MDSSVAAGRARAFLRTLDERASERVEQLSYGTAYWNPSLALVHDRTNFIRVAPGIGARALAGLLNEVEHEQGRAGLAHRKLVYDDDAGRATAGLLRPLGWQVRTFVLMVYRGKPWAAPPGHALTELDAPQARAAYERHLAESRAFDERSAGQQLDQDALVAASTDVRWFAAFAAREPVSICALWSEGRNAQIDAVSTLTQHRRRGHGGAVLTAALNAAVAADYDPIFLLAEEDALAARWYERAGFETVGVRCEAIRVAGATRA